MKLIVRNIFSFRLCAAVPFGLVFYFTDLYFVSYGEVLIMLMKSKVEKSEDAFTFT